MGKILHASYSGYFPFCIVEDSNVGPETYYPVGLTIQKAMDLWWNIRSWQIAGTAINTQFIPKFVMADSSTKEIANVEELVCARSMFGFEFVYLPPETPDGNSESIDWAILADEVLPVANVKIKKYNDLYYPLIYITAVYGNPEDPVQFGSTIKTGLFNTESGMLNFFGTNIQLWRQPSQLNWSGSFSSASSWTYE